MPPPKASYRSDLFDSSILTSVDAVDDAVDEFRAMINETNVKRMLDEVVAQEPPAVVRLVLTASDLEFEPALSEELTMSCFPTAPEGFGASAACKILSQLSEFFFFAESVPTLHENHHALVKEAPGILTALASKLFVRAEPEPAALKKGKATSQKKTKLARRAATQSNNTLDPAPFEHLKITVPETPDQVQQCVEIVLATQRSILEAYLESLRLPNVAASVKAVILPLETGPFPEVPSDPDEADVGPAYEQNDPPEESYPTLQPIKFSTLYRRRATGFGEWEVNIAPRAERDLREFNRRDRKTCNVIVNKMRELSNGDFSPDNHRQINEGNNEVPIYEAKVVEDLRLVYQIDCAPVYGKKIFGVYEDAQLTRGTFWDSMSRELGKKGQKYKDRCALRERLAGTEGYTFVPVTFPAHEEVRFSPGSVPDLPADDAEQIQSLLLKTVHFSQELLNNILTDRDVAVVLQISRSLGELEIIEHPHSCYVLGRSGTGKSTTMIYKMLMVEASSELSPPTARKIRQLFVCKSPILAEKVGEHFAKLIQGYRPVAVSGNVKASKKADRALVGHEDKDWRSDLPKKYSDLQDTDFPLFVSFEQLCSMIENDMLASNVVPTQKPTLTYAKFRREYWPHFPQFLCKGLDASMVFSELMGVVMGSEETLTNKSHCLDRKTYLNLSERGQSTFAHQRERIYDLFEKYLNQKRHQGDTDAADSFETYSHRRTIFWSTPYVQRQRKHPEFNFHPAIPPRVFELTVNYRSHTGIVNCARSVIEVITKLWPDAIDVLAPERGTVDGLRPIFFTNWESENMQSKQFLFGEQSGSPIELGAEQCILVRNDAARKKLKELVGDIGLIMTLDQSKGLEFNDVLLYNFFEDSGITEPQWRVVLNVIDNGPPAPTLDNIRHASVCTELKFLYVAITRARNNIWIADCSTKGQPMRMLWTSKNCVQNCELGTDTPRFAISSKPAVAEAYHLREEASEMPCNLRPEIMARKAAFLSVAFAFMDCAGKDSGDSARAYFRIAGESFESAETFVQAIAAYTSAQYFGRVAELYRQLGKFDEAVATVQTHREAIDPQIVERVINVARSFYFNKGQLKKASKLFTKQDEALAYLEDRGMNGERATVLESIGRLSDAAEIHLQDGRTSEAIELFLRDGNTARATDGVLQELWAAFSFGVLPNKQDTLVSGVLERAQNNEPALSQSKCDEISMFRAIADQDRPKLWQLGKTFLRTNNQPAALLCLDHYFADPPRIQALPIEAIAENLRVFFDYLKIMHQLALHVDPCSSSATRKLFGYRKEGENTFYIPPATFMHRTPSDNSGLLTSSEELRTIFQDSLRDRMAEKIREENQMCRVTKAFSGPCPTFALFDGHCNRANCPDEHILLSTFDSRQYNLRVRITLQQILIYQGINKIDMDQRRYWLARLYAVLNPVSYQFGSAASLDLNLIPEAPAALPIVKEWVRDGVYTLGFLPEFHFLTRLVQLAQLGFQFDGRNAMSYLTHGPCMLDPRQPLKYRRPPEGRYVVAEFISALEDQNEWSLSAGVVFLRHVIVSELKIQVNVLCDLAEHLCTGLVVADRLRFGSIHGVTLPLSWLVKRSVAGEGLGSPRASNSVWLFARALADLLERIYSGIRAVGYNFRSGPLRDFIGESITSLRNKDPNRRFTSVCSRYVNARTWPGLVAAVRASASGSIHDEMVQILHISREPLTTFNGVRQIIYEKITDIPRLLGSSQRMISIDSGPHGHQVADAVPTTHETTHDVPGDEEAEADERMPEDAPIDMPAISEPEPRSEDELRAAATIHKIILWAYRRVEQRKRATKSTLTSGLLEFFAECRGQALTMDRSHRLYRVYFLGPLPHLLLCLDIAHTRAQKETKQIQTEFKSAEHEAFETLDKKLTDVRRTLNQVIDLQKALNRSAEIHGRRNLSDLKKLAEQAVTLLQALPFSTPSGFLEHLNIAYKGILQPWKPVKRRAQPKPMLNTEDDEMTLNTDDEIYTNEWPDLRNCSFIEPWNGEDLEEDEGPNGNEKGGE
ncbi:hypothetical protein K438DRAFT_1778624 [Mycena galopus ATCC 62051]|nr:hypothetical protein K438DRAFT_1778624 [Mycena galopus ATCC 62051]